MIKVAVLLGVLLVCTRADAITVGSCANGQCAVRQQVVTQAPVVVRSTVTQRTVLRAAYRQRYVRPLATARPVRGRVCGPFGCR